MYEFEHTMKEKKLKPYRKMSSLLLIFSLLVGIFSIPAFAEATSSVKVNPLEENTSGLLSPRKSYYEQKENIDPEFFETGIRYFRDIAGDGMYSEGSNSYVKKWLAPVHVVCSGKYTEGQARLLDIFIGQINSLGLLPPITLSFDEAASGNVNIKFNTLLILQRELFNQSYTDKAGCWLWWKGEPAFELYWSHIGLATNKLSEEDNIDGLILQNMTQALGLMNHSNEFADSIFREDIGDLNSLSNLDWLILEMLYRPELKVGMEMSRAVDILEQLYLSDEAYCPDPDEIIAGQILTEARLAEEREQVVKDRERWPSFAIKVSHYGPRQTFYERRQDIGKEFFERGLILYEEIAGYGEFDSADDGFIKKWGSEPIKVYIEGNPPESVKETIGRTILQINSLGLLPPISYSYEKEPGQQIYVVFDTLANIQNKVRYAHFSQWGVFSYFWKGNPQYEIYSADIGVATDVTTEVTMRHLFQEEFIQCLGLINDSPEYFDSIFYSDYGHVLFPSELDWLLLEFHYRPEITPGMPIEEALAVLRELYLKDVE